MKLSQLLSEDLIVRPLGVEQGVTDKWSAIRALAERAAERRAVPAALFPTILAALHARERSMTTGMEHGVAIPHAAVDGVEEVVAVLGIAPEGVPFESLDGRPARLIFCLIIPRAKKLLHIHTLAKIAKLLARREVREAIVDAPDAAEVLRVVREAERE
jgi:mannitol/fructose-specific phosphotransferase system IIA component (Ntr-type)